MLGMLGVNGLLDFMFILVNLEVTTKRTYTFVMWDTNMRHLCAFQMGK